MPVVINVNFLLGTNFLVWLLISLLILDWLHIFYVESFRRLAIWDPMAFQIEFHTACTFVTFRADADYCIIRSVSPQEDKRV